MKFIEFIKKYQLILFLSFLVVVLIVLKIIYGNSNPDQNNIVLPTLTPTPEIIQNTNDIDEEVLNDGNPEYPLKKVLPYTTDKFKIIGYDEPYTLVVRIKSGTKTEVEKEIRLWIDKNLPGDSEHKLIFTD